MNSRIEMNYYKTFLRDNSSADSGLKLYFAIALPSLKDAANEASSIVLITYNITLYYYFKNA